MRRMIPILFFAAVVAGCSGAGACVKEGTAATAAPATPTTPPTPAATPSRRRPQAPAIRPPASALPGGPSAPAAKAVPAVPPAVIARVNKEDISKSDFEVAVNLEARAGSPVPASERDRVFRGVLDELIRLRLLRRPAPRKLTVPDSDIDARMVEVKRRFPLEQAFQKMLAERRLTLQQVRSEMKSEMVVNRLIDADRPQARRERRRRRRLLQRNPKEFAGPGEGQGQPYPDRRARWRRPGDQGERARQGDEFSRACAAAGTSRRSPGNSQDPAAPPTAEIFGFFQQGQMVGAFNDTAFKLGR